MSGGTLNALVTGGSRGIGEACVRALAARGHTVAFTYLSSRDRATAIARELSSAGRRVVPIRANLGNEHHLERVIETYERELDSIEVLVSNAAAGFLKPALETDRGDLERALGVNAGAFLALARWAGRRMAENDAGVLGSLVRGAEGRAPSTLMNRGRILAITSMGSTRYLPSYGSVGASKAALESLVRSLAVELAPGGVTVNAICPGVTETRSLSMFPGAARMVEETLERTPAGRVGAAGDIADLVCLLCSSLSHWVTGQTIVADGGHSLVLYGPGR